MTQMSLTDKIGILYEMIKSSKIYILVFIVLLFIGYVLTSTSKKKSQTIKIIFLIIYLIILGTIVYLNHVNLSNMFDYMMNNLFIVIYFPNLAVYLAAIIITNIIMWTSILNNKVSKLMRNINVTVYCIITYLLILILNIIKEEQLDVFTQSSVYGSLNAQALIELSSTVFILWIIYLGIYKIVKPAFIKKQTIKKDVIKEQVPILEQDFSPIEMPIRPIPEQQFIRKALEEKPYRQIQPPAIVIGNNKTPKKAEKEKNYRQIPAPSIVKATSPTITVQQIAEKVNSQEDLLTLEDYKLLLSILKSQRKKEQIERNSQIKIENEENKFHELQQLYSSVR